MSTFLNSRRRQLAVKGRPLILQRVLTSDPFTILPVTVQGKLTGFAPTQIIGGLQEGDAVAYILNDEILAAGWPGPPQNGDRIVEVYTWTVFASIPVWHGTLIIGHDLFIRGGS